MELLVYSQNNRHIVVNTDRVAAFPFHSNTLLADHTLWVCTYTWPFCDKPLYCIKVKKLGYADIHFCRKNVTKRRKLEHLIEQARVAIVRRSSEPCVDFSAVPNPVTESIVLLSGRIITYNSLQLAVSILQLFYYTDKRRKLQ